MDGEGYVYLDYNATTPFDPEVISTVSDSLVRDWGNASSSHYFGVRARKSVNDARKQVAEMISAHPNEIIFTSGGTEANHTILHSFASVDYKQSASSSGDQPLNIDKLPHIITSDIEHDSVRLPLELMAKHNLATVTFLPVNPASHRIEICDVISCIQENTRLVTIMLANNETGVIQPIRELSLALKLYCEANNKVIYLHTDAAQAIGKIPVSVHDLGVDYLTIVGHKFYGPRIGALYVRNLGDKENGCPLQPLLLGGGQERGFRAGTENTAMIAGFGKACELVKCNISSYYNHMLTMRSYLEDSLQNAFGKKVVFNAKSELSERLPNTCSMSIVGEEFLGRNVLSKCKELIASVGAACHSSNVSEYGSPLLIKSGVPSDNARNAIRLSVGRNTTKCEIDRAVLDLTNAVELLTKI